MRKACFLDRDGTIIVNVDYLREPSRIELLPDAGAALRTMRDNGFLLVVVTNQSGIARGLIAHHEHEAVRAEFERVLEAEGVTIDGYYFCPHAPDAGCACRKPSPGMLLTASRDLGIDLTKSLMIGDRESDVGAGKNAGCRTAFLAGTGVTLDYGADLAASSWRGLLPGLFPHDVSTL